MVEALARNLWYHSYSENQQIQHLDNNILIHIVPRTNDALAKPGLVGRLHAWYRYCRPRVTMVGTARCQDCWLAYRAMCPLHDLVSLLAIVWEAF